jgi:hypothetical protein
MLELFPNMEIFNLSMQEYGRRYYDYTNCLSPEYDDFDDVKGSNDSQYYLQNNVSLKLAFNKKVILKLIDTG